jgi:hypothetical protein
MNEIILPPLRSHVPGVAGLQPKPTWHLPIHVYTDNGIDLDFGPLLLFDKAVIDCSCLEYVQTSGRQDLVPLAASLTELNNAGYLEMRDFATELHKVRNIITDHVDRLVDNPLPLRDPVLRGINGYRSTVPFLHKAGAPKDDDVLSVGFGMHLYMLQKYGRIDPEEKRRLDGLMHSHKQRWSREELDAVRALIKPTITYLYQNLALGEVLGSPFVDVSYTSELYTILRRESLLAFNPNANLQAAQIREAQNMFSCIIPELRPASAKTMLKFLKSNAVKDFRAYISLAAQEGRSISEHDYKRLLISTLEAERDFGRLKDRLAWGERLVSLIPGAGLVASGLSVLVEKLIQRRTTKRNQWVCALIEAACSSKHSNSTHDAMKKGEND